MYQQTVTTDAPPNGSITISEDMYTVSGGKVRKPRASLDFSEGYRLWKFIEQNGAKYKEVTHGALAEVASKELGFEVSASSIADARQGLGVEFSRRRARSSRATTDRVRVVAQGLLNLCKQLNVSLGPDTEQRVRDIARGLATKTKQEYL